MEHADLPYRAGVGIALFNADGLVFVGRRRAEGGEHLGEHVWQMPQGGIDPGEPPIAAAYRELHEETGIRSAELIDEVPEWLTYDLPPALLGVAWKGRYRGQRQKWFAFRFTGEDTEIDVENVPDGHKAEFDAWRWVPLSEVPGLIVPFKRPVYTVMVRTFAPIAEVGAGV